MIIYVSYFETSIRDLKFSEAHKFEKSRFIWLELRLKQGMSHNMGEQLRSGINNNHISILRSKFIFVCNKSYWKDLGLAELNNISSINLNSVEIEALNFGLKLASGIKNHDIGKLINRN